MNLVSIRSRIRRNIKALAFLIGLYSCVAHLLSSIVVNPTPERGDIEIYILSTGVHTDIILPIETSIYDWRKDVRFEHTKSKNDDFNYVAFGWGDKGFYLETPEWEDLKATVALKAMTGFSSTAMHTTFYKDPITGTNCKAVHITPNQYENLTRYIQKSLERDSNGQLIHIVTDANYGSNDCFYEATGRYSLFKTCNSWANKALKSAGQKACLWTPFDDPIFEKYD